MLSGIAFMIFRSSVSFSARAFVRDTHWENGGKLSGNMTRASNLDESFMKGGEFRVLELIVVEAKEVIHDDVSRQSRKGMREIQGLPTRLELLNAHGKRVDMTMNDVDEIDDGPPGEPAHISTAARGQGCPA